MGGWKGILARERASGCLLSGLAWKVWMESWRGRCTQLTASWASTQEARPPCPLMLPILLRFKKGNVLFISHRPVETWQPLDGSDSTGILVTSGCLLLPLNCGCSNSKRPEVTGSKRKKKILFSVLCCFHETVELLVKVLKPFQTSDPYDPMKPFPTIFKTKSLFLFCRSREAEAQR